MDDQELHRRYRQYCESNRRRWRKAETAGGAGRAEADERLPPVLYFLAARYVHIERRERDRLVAERLRSHPEEAAVVFHDDSACPTALHHAARQAQFPPELLGELIDAFPGALEIPSRGVGSLPLHAAIIRRAPFRNVMLLLERGPSALGSRTNYGRLPVHYWAACRRQQSTLEEAVQFRDGLRSMLERFPGSAVIPDGRVGYGTVLDTLESEFLEGWEHDAGDERTDVEWETILMVLSTVHNVQKGKSVRISGGDDAFFPVHALIEVKRADSIDLVAQFYENSGMETEIPWAKLRKAVKDGKPGDFKSIIVGFSQSLEEYDKDMPLTAYRMARNELLGHMIERYPEEARKMGGVGNLPLHLVARSSRMTNNIIELLLQKYPYAAKTPDGSGQLPLHIASASGMTWEEGMKIILDAHPEALEVPDRTFQLCPFMLAAVGKNNSVDSVYRLLREAPKMVLPIQQGQVTEGTIDLD